MSYTAPPQLELDQIEDVARKLAAAISQRRIYAAEHSRVESALREFQGRLHGLFGEATAERFRLTTTDGMLAHEGVPIGAGEGGTALIAQQLEERECGGLSFHPQTPYPEIRALVGWLAARRPGVAPPLHHIELLEPGAGDQLHDGGGDMIDAFEEFRLPKQIHSMATAVMTHVMTDARKGRGLDFSEISQLTQMATEAALSEGNRLFAATQLKPEESSPLQHSVNVFILATTMLRGFTKDKQELERLSQAALLHDVGKSILSTELALKKDDLTEAEVEELQRHPELGAELLAKMPNVHPAAIEVAYCHHMRDDGLGYPRPILPINPGPVTSLVQIGDMFETIAADRPDRVSLTTDQAVNCILKTPGMASKKSTMRLMMRRLTSSPPGSEVVLESGARAVVVETFQQSPDHPLVRVIRDPDGKPIADPVEIDLRQVAANNKNPIREVYLKPK